MSDKPKCITFAAPVGSSKTPISHFLSCKLGLPIFNNDAIRSGVIEDVGSLDQETHLNRRNEAIKDLLKNQMTFICDVSQDREWEFFKAELNKHGYDFFVISIDLGKEFLTKLFEDKKYLESLSRIDQIMQDHQAFVETYKDDIDIVINESNFSERFELCRRAVADFLET